MKKKNKGLSIVELVIAMAIMAVIAGFTLYSVGNIRNYRARECSRKITSSLQETKISSLGKAKSNGDMVWELYNDNGKIYVRMLKDCKTAPAEQKNTKVSKGTVRTLSVVDSTGTERVIGNGSSVKLSFDRATGSLYTCGANLVSSTGTGTASQYVVNSGSYSTIRQIKVSNGGNIYTTQLTPATGKIKD